MHSGGKRSYHQISVCSIPSGFSLECENVDDKSCFFVWRKERLALCNHTSAVSGGNELGGAAWEEMLAKGFTVQKRQAASKAKQCHCQRVISFHE